MASFTSIIYDEASETVSFGAGCRWDEVYAILEPYNVTVAGGRVPGVGRNSLYLDPSAVLIFFFSVGPYLFLGAGTVGLRTNMA